MSPSDTEKVLRFMMSKLPPADLEELDGMLDGGAEPMASDARLGSNEQRRDWLKLGPRERNIIRKSKAARMAADAGSSKDFSERFPEAAHIRSL